MNKKIVVSVGSIVIVAVAYWLTSPFWRNRALHEELPSATTMDMGTRADFEKQTITGRADMIARAHAVEGVAFLVTSGNETWLRFENLKTINGPDLRIYLSSGLNTDDSVDLGPIRATEGNVNYAIPVGTNLGKYKNALIWCRAFGVLFSYAQF